MSAESLDELVELERKVLNILDIAARTCSSLSQYEATPQHESELKDLSDAFIQNVYDIKAGLLNQISDLAHNEPYRNSISCYGQKKDLEIYHRKTELIHNQLENLSSILEDLDLVKQKEGEQESSFKFSIA
eukprot:TRINITY_DN949_c0_g1_i3.p1 TRINITY_DN949_c0_g1~~TRINITY_DN949_c0_g1_i3.p1  ORF type:complete len:131 (+),score=29.22 TRINITY_DN949_c0_g1_i3:26-418(+)